MNEVDKILSDLHDYVNKLRLEGNLRDYEFYALKEWILNHMSEESYHRKVGH